MRTRTVFCVAILVGAVGAIPSRAGTILSPVNVVFNGMSGTTTAHIYDQSGLSTSFSSGVTDYDAYVTGNPTHAPLSLNPLNGWASGPLATAIRNGTNDMVFDLGQAYTVLAFALWTNSNSSAIDSFTLLSGTNSAVTQNVTNLGGFTASESLTVQSFTFQNPGVGEYVELQVNSSHGSTTVNIGEVAFDVVAPEPASLTVLAAGILGLAGLRRSARP